MEGCYVIIITSDSELDQYCYLPLKSGGIYWSEWVNNSYSNVFFSGDVYHTVHVRHFRELELDEVRDFKLKQLLDDERYSL